MNGGYMFNDLSSVQAYLATRRSGKPRDMVAPGPDASTLAEIVALATRTPDHGKLFPWRLTHIADRKAFATLLEIRTHARPRSKPPSRLPSWHRR